jgi:hypothetical protein
MPCPLSDTIAFCCGILLNYLYQPIAAQVRAKRAQLLEPFDLGDSKKQSSLHSITFLGPSDRRDWFKNSYWSSRSPLLGKRNVTVEFLCNTCLGEHDAFSSSHHVTFSGFHLL